MIKKVACSEFVKRQTKDSSYSHFEGGWDELEYRASGYISDPDKVKPGYKDGVCLVNVYEPPPANQFYSSIVKLYNDSKLLASFEARRPNESSYIKVSVKGDKTVAKEAHVVLYSAEVLKENNEQSTNAEWEIVSINASATTEDAPMHYYTMARNFLYLEGGTRGEFSAEEFAKSIVYWNSHATVAPKSKLHAKFIAWINDGGSRIWENLLHHR